ncbi:hypothetical protein D3C86_1700400 [compost metagenome]
MPTRICGLENPSALPASTSRWAIKGTAFSKAWVKECVWRNCSLNTARPKKVSSERVPQPYEVWVASAAVMMSVLSVARGSIQPPE